MEQNQKQTAGSLAQTLIKSRLVRGAYMAEVGDKQTSQEVEGSKNAKSGTVKTQLALLAGCEEHKVLLQAYNTGYSRFRELTFPWGEDAWRGIVGANFMDIADEMGTHIKDFHAKADHFCFDVYPEYFERAMFNAGGAGLGELADRVLKKYPSPDTIREKFYMELKAEPMPAYETAARFGVVFTEQDVEEKLKAAQDHAWKSLADPIQKLFEQCRDKDETGKWASSYLDNIVKQAKIARQMNIYGDTMFSQFADLAEELVKGVTKEDLKHDPLVRNDMRSKAQDLIERMNGYL